MFHPNLLRTYISCSHLHVIIVTEKFNDLFALTPQTLLTNGEKEFYNEDILSGTIYQFCCFHLVNIFVGFINKIDVCWPHTHKFGLKVSVRLICITPKIKIKKWNIFQQLFVPSFNYSKYVLYKTFLVGW